LAACVESMVDAASGTHGEPARELAVHRGQHVRVTRAAFLDHHVHTKP